MEWLFSPAIAQVVGVTIQLLTSEKRDSPGIAAGGYWLYGSRAFRNHRASRGAVTEPGVTSV